MELVNVEYVSEVSEIIPSVWTMRKEKSYDQWDDKIQSKVEHSLRKANTRDQLLGNLCTCGSMVCYKVDVCLCNGLGWKLWQVDFVMLYIQAPTECDVYMKFPAGIGVQEGTTETHVLKLLKNLYDCLAEKLIEADFQ